MGWSNYLLIPKWKLAIEISRHVDGAYVDRIEERYDVIETFMNELRITNIYNHALMILL